MLDSAIRKRTDPILNRIGSFLAKKKIHANHLTVFGFFCGLVCMVMNTQQHYLLALLFLTLNRVFDGLDGCLARQTKPTDQGAYLDIVLDFLFYSGFVFSIALALPEFALHAAFLIFSFVGTGSSFLAYSIFAEKRKIPAKQHKNKSLVYLGGLTEGFETIFCFVLILLFPDYFPSIALVFGFFCWITTGTRIYTSWKDLKDDF